MFVTLPEDVLASIVQLVLVSDLLNIESASKVPPIRASRSFAFKTPNIQVLRRQVRKNEIIWEVAVKREWSKELVLGENLSWRSAAIFLESCVYPMMLKVGCKAALRLLVAKGMLQASSLWASQATLDIIRAGLSFRGDIEYRRRVALFACSSDFCSAKIPVGTLSDGDNEDELCNIVSVLSCFEDQLALSNDPEEALRGILMVFPFLPIDAGEGADRVIRALARLYLKHHETKYASLRARSIGEIDTHNDRESAIYILMYAVIMLNTDLHHPAIKSKMTPAEFILSTRRTVLGEAFSDADLNRIYESVATQQFLICSPQLQRNLTNLLDHDTRLSSLESRKAIDRRRQAVWSGITLLLVSLLLVWYWAGLGLFSGGFTTGLIQPRGLLR